MRPVDYALSAIYYGFTQVNNAFWQVYKYHTSLIIFIQPIRHIHKTQLHEITVVGTRAISHIEAEARSVPWYGTLQEGR